MLENHRKRGKEEGAKKANMGEGRVVSGGATAALGSEACRGLRAGDAGTGHTAPGAAKDASQGADPTAALLPAPRMPPHCRHTHAPPLSGSLQFTQ